MSERSEALVKAIQATGKLDKRSARLVAGAVMASDLVVWRESEKAELVFPDDLKIGDRVLVECEVYDDPAAYPPGAHLYVRPPRDSMWNASDQCLWTWNRRMKSHPEPYVRRAPKG